MSRLVHGWGINDLKGSYNKSFNLCPIYKTWKKMIGRCYDPKYIKTRPTYIGCSVSEEWKYFSNFRSWMENLDYEGMCLDKDILLPGNKVYSESTCVFVPAEINCFFTFNKTSTNNFPLGVTWCSSENKYKAYCADLTGKNKTLGRFDNPRTAGEAYKVFKESLARTLADKYRGKLDGRLIEALNNFTISKYSNKE